MLDGGAKSAVLPFGIDFGVIGEGLFCKSAVLNQIRTEMSIQSPFFSDLLIFYSHNLSSGINISLSSYSQILMIFFAASFASLLELSEL